MYKVMTRTFLVMLYSWFVICEALPIVLYKLISLLGGFHEITIIFMININSSKVRRGVLK